MPTLRLHYDGWIALPAGLREALEEGRLVRLLPEWSLPPFGIYAVTPRRDAQPAKVKVAIEALRRHLGGSATLRFHAPV